MSKKTKSVFERSAEIVNTETSTDGTVVDDFPNASLTSFEAIAMKDTIDSPALSNNSLTSSGDVEISQNAPNKTIFNGRMLALVRHTNIQVSRYFNYKLWENVNISMFIEQQPREQEEKIQARSSEVASLNEDIDTNVKPFASNVSMQVIQNEELSTRLTRNNKEDIFAKQNVLIEVNAESNLVAVPGRIHTIYFDLTNNCVLTVRYAVRATSSSFGIANIRPS